MKLLYRLSAGVVLLCSTAALAADLDTQRSDFKLAWAAAQQGDLKTLTPYLETLSSYPLYPYLRYAYLDSTLTQQTTETLQAFLKEQAQLPVAEALRQDWLLQLARRQQWGAFLANYQDETDPALRCAAVSAHLEIGRASCRERV